VPDPVLNCMTRELVIYFNDNCGATRPSRSSTRLSRLATKHESAIIATPGAWRHTAIGTTSVLPKRGLGRSLRAQPITEAAQAPCLTSKWHLIHFHQGDNQSWLFFRG